VLLSVPELIVKQVASLPVFEKHDIEVIIPFSNVFPNFVLRDVVWYFPLVSHPPLKSSFLVNFSSQKDKPKEAAQPGLPFREPH
jgi:hypothetical protein